jgi:hypothetical protein
MESNDNENARLRNRRSLIHTSFFNRSPAFIGII